MFHKRRLANPDERGTVANVCVTTSNRPINWQAGERQVRYLYGQEADVRHRREAGMLATELNTRSAVAERQRPSRS